MAHQIPHIMVSLLIVGILGTSVLVSFFNQSVDSSIKPLWVVLPLLSVTFIGLFILKTAREDRD